MTRFRQRAATLLVAVALALGGGAVATTPAHAAWTDCPVNSFCVFNGSNGTGSHYHWTLTGMFNGQCTNIGAPWDNVAKSAVMTTSNNYTVRLWTSANCTGLSISTMWSGGIALGDCGGPFNWYAVASPCNAPTGSSFRYYL